MPGILWPSCGSGTPEGIINWKLSVEPRREGAPSTAEAGVLMGQLTYWD
jgi:hypothetical protein